MCFVLFVSINTFYCSADIHFFLCVITRIFISFNLPLHLHHHSIVTHLPFILLSSHYVSLCTLEILSFNLCSYFLIHFHYKSAFYIFFYYYMFVSNSITLIMIMASLVFDKKNYNNFGTLLCHTLQFVLIHTFYFPLFII